MQKQKFDEIVSYFNKKVSEMEIETKYKMELLGMVTALGYAHEKETHDKRTETHACDCERTETNDLVSRRSALEAMDTWDKFGCDPNGKLVRYDDDKHYVPYVRYEDMVYAVKNLPSAEPEIVRCGQCKYAEVVDKEDAQDGYTCQFHRGSIWFSGSYCSWAERRTDETD